jgi:hypothetical protein
VEHGCARLRPAADSFSGLSGSMYHHRYLALSRIDRALTQTLQLV